MDNQDDHYLRITGKVNLPTALEVDTEYEVIGVISTYGCDSSSKQDGTHNHTHKAMFSDAVQLIKGEQVILGKKKRGSQSQQFRAKVLNDGYEYEKYMDAALAHFDEVTGLLARYL